MSRPFAVFRYGRIKLLMIAITIKRAMILEPGGVANRRLCHPVCAPTALPRIRYASITPLDGHGQPV
ncbi:MAG: hypothetical protein EOP09_08825 [Proteobacteria bacterium]|nr:MAG: hypothetical protein EOP09_08825 [Pseudomonadota bacterium]